MTRGVSTRYIWDGQNEVEERNGAGVPLRQFMDGPGVDEVIEIDSITASQSCRVQGLLGPVSAACPEAMGSSATWILGVDPTPANVGRLIEHFWPEGPGEGV